MTSLQPGRLRSLISVCTIIVHVGVAKYCFNFENEKKKKEILSFARVSFVSVSHSAEFTVAHLHRLSHKGVRSFLRCCICRQSTPIFVTIHVCQILQILSRQKSASCVRQQPVYIVVELRVTRTLEIGPRREVNV